VIGSTLIHDICSSSSSSSSITTVFLVANTYCMMEWCMWTEPLMTDRCMQQDVICYQWFKQRSILSVSEPSISQRTQIKEDSVEPSVLARDINLNVHLVDLHALTSRQGPEFNSDLLGTWQPDRPYALHHSDLPLHHEGRPLSNS